MLCQLLLILSISCQHQYCPISHLGKAYFTQNLFCLILEPLVISASLYSHHIINTNSNPNMFLASFWVIHSIQKVIHVLTLHLIEFIHQDMFCSMKQFFLVLMLLNSPILHNRFLHFPLTFG
jgi:hypothetical protein